MKTEPTTDRGRATLERILDASSELFYVQGVRATGLDQISAASGTGKGQLYHYFSAKSELVLAVIERQVDRVLAAQEPLISSLDNWANIDAWLAALLAAHERSDDPLRCPLGALASELAENDPDARTALAAGFDRWWGHLADGLRALQAAGELSAEVDCDALAQGALAAYQGGLLLSQVRGDLDALSGALEMARTALRAAQSGG